MILSISWLDYVSFFMCNNSYKNDESLNLSELKSSYTDIFCFENKSKQKIKRMSLEELTSTLSNHFKQLVDSGSFDEIVSLIDSLSQILDVDSLGDLESLKTDVMMLQEILKRKNNNVNFYEIDNKIKNFCLHLLDKVKFLLRMFILSFGITDILYATSDYQITSMIYSFMSNFSSLEYFLKNIVGLVEVRYIQLIFSIAVVGSFFWSFVRPHSESIHHLAKNLSLDVKFSVSFNPERKQITSQIMRSLRANRHVLLVGPSRVGKTSCVRSLAQSLERGDYPDFSQTRVYQMNTANLVRTDPLSALTTIAKNAQESPYRTILVLDEIHNACIPAKEGVASLSETLKTTLEDNFPKVIGITTTQEYEEYIKKNIAFQNRFDLIFIEQPSLEELPGMLFEMILKKEPLIMDEGVIESIIQNSQGLCPHMQPASCLRVLDYAIEETKKRPSLEKEDHEAEMDNEDFLMSAKKFLFGNKHEKKVLLEKSNRPVIDDQNFKKFEDKKKAFSRFKNLTLDYARHIPWLKPSYRNKEILSQINKIYESIVNKLTSHETIHMKKIALYQRFVIPYLEASIRQQAKDLSCDVVLNAALVEKVVQNLKESDSQLQVKNI